MARERASRDPADLRRTIEGACLFIKDNGSSDVDIAKDADPVHIAIVFNVQGYGPHVAAIRADQSRSGHSALEEAYEDLESWERDGNADHLKELEKEYGDEADAVFRENFDGRIWKLSPREFWTAIRGTSAEKFFDLRDSAREDFDPADPKMHRVLLTIFEDSPNMTGRGTGDAADAIGIDMTHTETKDFMKRARESFDKMWGGTPMRWSTKTPNLEAYCWWLTDALKIAQKKFGY